MKRSFVLYALVGVLLFALAGCGDSPDQPATGASQESTATVTIADERIVGQWTGEDGDVEFREDGTLILDDGTALPFTMPQADKLEISFPGRTVIYAITWEGDDRHGIVSEDSTETTPTWYDRKE